MEKVNNRFLNKNNGEFATMKNPKHQSGARKINDGTKDVPTGNDLNLTQNLINNFSNKLEDSIMSKTSKKFATKKVSNKLNISDNVNPEVIDTDTNNHMADPVEVSASVQSEQTTASPLTDALTKGINPKTMNKKRLAYIGSLRSYNTLEGKIDDLEKIVTTGILVKEVLAENDDEKDEKDGKDNKDNKPTFQKIRLTPAQVASYRAKLEEVKSDIIIKKEELKENEFNFKTASRKRQDFAKHKVKSQKQKIADRKFARITTLLDKVQKESDAKTLNGLKTKAGNGYEKNFNKFKSDLVKFINALNKGNLPLGNLSNSMVERIINIIK